MEIRILDSIMHGELKPWKVQNNPRRFLELIKKVSGEFPISIWELTEYVSKLLTDFPNQYKLIEKDTSSDVPIKSLIFTIQLPNYIDSFTGFYYRLITADCIRIYNMLIDESVKWKEIVDVRYQIGKVLTDIRVLCKQTTTELNDRGFNTIPAIESNPIHYTLYYLKHRLIQLYFSIQEYFKGSLRETVSIEDYYLFHLEDSTANIVLLVEGSTLTIADSTPTDEWQIEKLRNENIEIEKIEVEIRRLVVNIFEITSIAVFKQVVPSHIQEKIRINIEKESKKNPALISGKSSDPNYLLQFSDLQELQAILTAKSNWEKVEHLFGTKENLVIEFNNLAGLRNPLRHSREVDEISHLKGQAAIKWFKKQLQMNF